jgi:hypothetical protein
LSRIDSQGEAMKKKLTAFLLCAVMTASAILPVYAAGNSTAEDQLPSSFNLTDQGGHDKSTALNLSLTALEASASGTSFGSGTEGDSVTVYQKDGQSLYTPDPEQQAMILVRDYGASQISLFRMNDASAVTPETRIKKALEANEAVLLNGTELIVGWDDSGDGAWLVRSADASSAEIAKTGYADASISSAEVLCAELPDSTAAGFSYRYDDGLGDGRYTPGQVSASAVSPDMANVFTAEHDENLTAVSFFTSKDSADYSISIYTGLSDPEDPSSGTAAMAEPQSGTADFSGFHTVKLASAVSLTKGTAFSVCIHFADASEDLFYDTDQTVYDSNGNAVFTSQAAAEKGQSFIRTDGVNWTDFSGDGNLRIHALTDYGSTADGSQQTADASDAGELLGASATPLADGSVYVIHSYAQSSFVLDVSGASFANMGNVQLYNYNATNAQKWVAKRSGSGYVFISLNSGKVMDVAGGSTADGANIQQYQPNGTEAQSWELQANSDGSYTFVSVKSGKVIDIAGAIYSSGTNIQTWTSNGTGAQKFTFEEVSQNVSTEKSLFSPQCAAGKCLDIAGGSTADHANIQLYSMNHTSAQDFQLISTGSGLYKIVNSDSGKVLDCDSGKSTEGTNIQLYTDNGTPAQQWRAVINADGTCTFFSALKSDMALTVNGASSSNFANVDLESGTGSAGQRFTLKERTQNDLNGTYSLRSVLNTDRVADVAGGSSSSGANIQLYDDNRTAAQQFNFVHVSGDVYVIYHEGTNQVLDVTNGQIGNGANVQQYEYNGSAAQQWSVTDNIDGSYTIHSMLDKNYVLDVNGASTAYRTNIQTYQSNGSDAQKWYLSSEQVNSCTLISSDTVQVSGSGVLPDSDDGKVYLFAIPATVKTLQDCQPAASASAGSSFTLTASLNKDSADSRLQDRFYTAVLKDGLYHVTSNGYYIQNPDACASKTTARVKGYNKKGLATSGWGNIDEAISLGASHVAENMPVLNWVSGSGYDYTYEGVTYSFNSSLDVYIDHVKKLTAAGVEVTGVIYMQSVGASSEYAQYITPTGRDAASQGATLAGMNATEAGPRKKLEALFACLADAFSDPDCQIGNWVIGNEVDNPVNWNWCGGISEDQYIQQYADVYRMAYTAMKSVWNNVRVYTSLDHVWNTTSRGSSYYTAKDILDGVNSMLSSEGTISWDLAFHPYCAPEQDSRFWNRTAAVTDDSSTQIITMSNIQVLTDYVRQYGSDHHIILSECGFSSYYPTEGKDLQAEQAAAIAYGYYIAETNPYIDNFIVHQLKDDANEMAGGWYLGLCNSDGSHKPAYAVFHEMDWKNNAWVQTAYCVVISPGSTWESLIPGYTPASFVH